jgi:hypothetical protein
MTAKPDVEVEKELTEEEKQLAIIKDLVELAQQTQVVLINASIPYPEVDNARLLAMMTNQIL